MEETTEGYRNRMRAEKWVPWKGLKIIKPKVTAAPACLTFPLPEITDGNVARGLTFKESITHTYVDDFSVSAFRKAYVKALFYEDEKWIRFIESTDKGRPMYPIVESGAKYLSEKNDELQAELRYQIYKDFENREGYYEAWAAGKPSGKWGKYLHQDVKRFIQKYNQYQNKGELNGNREKENSARRLSHGVVRHEQAANRNIAKYSRPSVPAYLKNKKSLLRGTNNGLAPGQG